MCDSQGSSIPYARPTSAQQSTLLRYSCDDRDRTGPPSLAEDDDVVMSAGKAFSDKTPAVRKVQASGHRISVDSCEVPPVNREVVGLGFLAFRLRQFATRLRGAWTSWM